MHEDNFLLSFSPQPHPCPPPASDWYAVQATFQHEQPAAWRDQHLDHAAAHSFYPYEESNSSRSYFVPATQDLTQAYDTVRYRHFESLPYVHTPATFSSNTYSSPASLYYAENYHPTRKSEQTPYEMTEATAGMEKFSFEDFEVMHAGDILALESPLPSHAYRAAAKKWPDVSQTADISSELICTHSDSSCDEYIVTSLDDSSTSSCAVTYCSAENWTSPGTSFNEQMGRTCMVANDSFMHIQPDTGIKVEGTE